MDASRRQSEQTANLASGTRAECQSRRSVDNSRTSKMMALRSIAGEELQGFAVQRLEAGPSAAKHRDTRQASAV